MPSSGHTSRCLSVLAGSPCSVRTRWGRLVCGLEGSTQRGNHRRSADLPFLRALWHEITQLCLCRLAELSVPLMVPRSPHNCHFLTMTSAPSQPAACWAPSSAAASGVLLLSSPSLGPPLPPPTWQPVPPVSPRSSLTPPSASGPSCSASFPHVPQLPCVAGGFCQLFSEGHTAHPTAPPWPPQVRVGVRAADLHRPRQPPHRPPSSARGPGDRGPAKSTLLG